LRTPSSVSYRREITATKKSRSLGAPSKKPSTTKSEASHRNASSGQAPAAIDNAVNKVADEVTGLVARDNKERCKNAHLIGQKVCGLTKIYGDSAVKKLSKKIRLDSSTLYTYKRIASAYSNAEFVAALARKNDRGDSLGVWDFNELAKFDDKKQRANVFERALAENWSTRDLKKKRAEALDASASAKANSQPPATFSTPAQAVLDALSDVISSKQDRIDDLARIKTALSQLASTSSSDARSGQCTKARDAVKYIIDAYKQIDALLGDEINRSPVAA
jgi:hypothetical protein